MKYHDSYYKMRYILRHNKNPLCRMDEKNITQFPPTIMSETSDNYRLRILLPSFSLDDFSISIKDNMLLLKGRRLRDSILERQKLHSSFMRVYTFNYCLERDNVFAELENGVLFIELIKRKSDRVDILAHEVVNHHFIADIIKYEKVK